MKIASLIIIVFITILLISKYRMMGLMYALIFLLPFRVDIFTVNSIGIRVNDLLALLYVIYWIVILFSSKIKKNDLKIMNKILAFTVFLGLSFLINALRFNSTINLIDFVRFILTVTTGVAISTTVKTRENILRVFKIWTFSATLSSIFSITTFFLNGFGISTIFNLNNLNVVEFYSIKFANSTFFEDPNNLATYLVISIFITLGLMLTKKISIKYIYLVLPVQSLGLLLTLSRSAYFAVAGALLVLLLFFKKKSIKWMFIKAFVIIMLFWVIYSFYQGIGSDVSIMSRIGLWQVGINMTLSNPLIGVGIGNSTLYFDEYIKSSLLIYNPHFHNLFLTISSEFGITGLLLFISIFFKNLLSLNKYNDGFYSFLVIGLIAYFIQSMGVEYFSSRHFWIFVPLLIQYKSFLDKGGRVNGLGVSNNASI